MKMQVTLYSATGEQKGKMELPEALFGQQNSLHTLQEAVVVYQANQRRGTSDTKTRAEVSGGGHKPWRQKGTGNARSGSNRSPLWRKGGIIFGPHQRSYRIEMSEDKRRLALATALTVKAQNKEISILESIPEGEGKTGVAGKFFGKTAPKGRILVIVDKKNDVLKRALKNLNRVSLVDVRELNPWLLMKAQQVLLTQPALQALESRFPQG